MVDVRKGILKPEQEDKVDKLIKFKNPILEMVDGPIIKTVDNVLLEPVMTKLEEKYPDIVPYVYEIIDTVIDAFEVEE